MVLQSEREGLEIQGELNPDRNHTWMFRFPSPWYSKSILKIQSTLFRKPINLIPRSNPNENDPCAYPQSSHDFITCCHPCSTSGSCAHLKLLLEHTRYDLIVTNRGLMLRRSTEDFICSLFPTVDFSCLNSDELKEYF